MSKEATATKKWEEMGARERDAWIAERVFEAACTCGKPTTGDDRSNPHGKEGFCRLHGNACLRFTTTATADNEVREAMRGKDPDTVEQFYDALGRILQARWSASDESIDTDFDVVTLYPMHFYEVGDYSHAAYMTLAD